MKNLSFLSPVKCRFSSFFSRCWDNKYSLSIITTIRTKGQVVVRKPFQIQTCVCLWVTLTQQHRPQTTNLAFSLHYTPWRSHSHKFEMILISTRMHWTGKTTHHVLVPWCTYTHRTHTCGSPPPFLLPDRTSGDQCSPHLASFQD